MQCRQTSKSRISNQNLIRFIKKRNLKSVALAVALSVHVEKLVEHTKSFLANCNPYKVFEIFLPRVGEGEEKKPIN